MSRIFSKCVIVISVFLTACAGNKPITVDPQQVAMQEQQARIEKQKQAQLLADFEMAVGKISEGELSTAKEILLSITGNTDKFSGPYVNLALIEEKQNNLKQAEALYLKAIEINPANLVAYNHLALLKRKEGQFQDALHYFKSGLKVQPDHPDLNYNAGVLYELYLQDFTKARQHYERYLKASDNPDDDVHKWLLALERK